MCRDYDYYRDCPFEYNESISDGMMVHHITMHCYCQTYYNTGKVKSTFISVMKTIPLHKKSLIGRIFVALCVDANRGPYHYDCIEAMLSGETGHHVDINFVAPAGVTALHMVAIKCNWEIVELLISYGANADVRGVKAEEGYICQDGYGTKSAGLLPIELALNWKEEQRDPYCWTSDSEETMINLLLDLLNAKKRENEYLKTIGLLASKTKEIGQVIHRCVREAEIINLAILLLVARQKVMSLTMLEGKEASASEGGLRIRECIMTEIATLTDEELTLTSKDDCYILSQNLEHKKKKLMFALLMLEVFEKAGDAFDRYLQSKSENGTSKDVAGLLKDAGCNLKDSMKIIQAKSEEFKENKFQSTVPQLSLCSQTDCLNKTKQEPIKGIQYQQRMSISTRVPRGCAAKASSSALGFSFQFPTAGKAQFMKTTKRTEHHGTSFVSNKQWLSFAYTLKRFIRRL